MKVTLKAVKERPTALGADSYGETWSIKNGSDLHSLDCSLLHPLKKQILDYLYKNGRDEEAERVKLDFYHIEDLLQFGTEFKSNNFQFSTGDYTYTITICKEDGGYVH